MADIIIPNYRIGNDLPISFFVEINQGGMVLSPDNTTILFYDPYGYQAEVRWNISGNQVSGTFLGKDQKRTGLYTLKVILNKGEAGMATSDRQMFRLVPHTWEGDTEPGGWEDFTLTMTDVISVEEMEEIRDIINQGFPDLEGRVNQAIAASERVNAVLYEEDGHAMLAVTDHDGNTVTKDVRGPQGPQGQQGEKGDKGDKGDQGIQGIQGEKGDTGNAATIAVGTVTTGAAGTSASVANSGTSGAAVFDFTIPKGDKGDKGEQGAPGDYTKPSGGIPSTDMTSEVQASLGKADTALQQITDTEFETIFNDW